MDSQDRKNWKETINIPKYEINSLRINLKIFVIERWKKVIIRLVCAPSCSLGINPKFVRAPGLFHYYLTAKATATSSNCAAIARTFTELEERNLSLYSFIPPHWNAKLLFSLCHFNRYIKTQKLQSTDVHGAHMAAIFVSRKTGQKHVKNYGKKYTK